MKVVGRQRLDDFGRRHAEAASRMRAWLAEVEEAEWGSSLDIKRRYPSASFVGDRRVVFNIGGNRYRIDAKVSYRLQQVLIVRVGTHTDYDGWTY